MAKKRKSNSENIGDKLPIHPIVEAIQKRGDTTKNGGVVSITGYVRPNGFPNGDICLWTDFLGEEQITVNECDVIYFEELDDSKVCLYIDPSADVHAQVQYSEKIKAYDVEDWLADDFNQEDSLEDFSEQTIDIFLFENFDDLADENHFILGPQGKNPFGLFGNVRKEGHKLRDPIASHPNSIEAIVLNKGRRTKYVKLHDWPRTVNWYLKYIGAHVKPVRANINGVIFEAREDWHLAGVSYYWDPVRWLDPPQSVTNALRQLSKINSIVKKAGSKKLLSRWKLLYKKEKNALRKFQGIRNYQALKKQLKSVLDESQRRLKNEKEIAKLKKAYDAYRNIVKAIGNGIKKRRDWINSSIIDNPRNRGRRIGRWRLRRRRKVNRLPRRGR